MEPGDRFTMVKSSNTHGFVASLALLGAAACSGSPAASSQAGTGGEPGTGGVSSAVSGTDTATGGGPSTSITGGATSMGGTPATGGNLGSGGSTTSGSVATGGNASGTGGKANGTGGTPNGTGGKASVTGGVPNATGGVANATGGVPNATGGTSTSAAGSSATGWLRTEGNKILLPNGNRFHGRGVNIFDTRDAGACGWAPPIIDEWIRRVDVLIDTWHANFFRLDLTSWATNQVGGTTVVQYKDVTQDASYLADVKKLVDHIGTKPGVYVMITLFSHPSQDANELPTAATQAVYTKLAQTFLDSPQVLYGITNEPHDTTDSAVWTAMNTAVQTYRSAEATAGPHHIVAVQGTQSYARQLAYYVTHPITAGSGANVVYETHVYDPQTNWQTMFIDPSATIPVIIGEYGPDGTYMKTVADAQALQAKAEQLEIPYIGWSFSSQNGPTMLVGTDADECTKVNWATTPSDWGKAIISRLANAW